MKKKLIIAVDVVLVLILVGIMAFMIIDNTRPDASKFKKEYEALNNSNVKIELNEKNPIKYLSVNEVFDLFENKTGVIYFGFPGCPWCRNMLPVLFDSAKQNSVNTVYYFNPREIRGENNEDYNKLITILNEFLTENENGEKTLYVPDVYFVKDGKIVGNHLGTVDSQTNPMESLTEEQKQELLNIYNDLFKKIKD